MAMVKLSQDHRQELERTSWKALRPDTIELICKHLDEKRLLKTKNKVYRDFRGLWQKVKLNNNEVLPVQETAHPTKLLFSYLKEHEKEFKVLELLENLQDMDRNDILDQLIHETRPNSSVPIILEDCYFAQQKFDSIVISSENDRDFEGDLLRRMSESGLNSYSYTQGLQNPTFDINVKPYEIVKYDVRSILSNKRCKSVIAIFSPAFLNHSAYYFLLYEIMHHQYLGYCNIIPIIWKECTIENYGLKYLSKLKYSTSGDTNFYERLIVKTLGANPESMTQENKHYSFMDDVKDIHEMRAGQNLNLRNMQTNRFGLSFRKYIKMLK